MANLGMGFTWMYLDETPYFSSFTLMYVDGIGIFSSVFVGRSMTKQVFLLYVAIRNENYKTA